MAGYDHMRKDLRVFRLDRMETVLVTTSAFERPASFRLSQLNKEDQSSRTVYTVKISRDILRWVKEQPPYKLVKIKSKKTHVLVTIESSSEESVIQWMLRWGEKAEALFPLSFRHKVKSLLASLLQKYQ